MIKAIKKLMPKISDTERAALECYTNNRYSETVQEVDSK